MNYPKGHWMLTYTGRAYWPASPRAQDVSIIDIAHHLAMLCRYTGAVPRFYSVAEHSVHVSYLVSRKNAMLGLMHDSPEFAVNDINRPTKYGTDLRGYRRLERLNWLAIAERFGLPTEIPAEVHKADNDMLFHERLAVMNHPIPPGLEWGMGLQPPEVLRPEIIQCWSWQEAKMRFLARYIELGGK